jgi:NADPH:quinone reductase-like Zn-dependent oxidoreductase
MKAVRFDNYGGIDVLNVVDVERPDPAAGEVLVKVVAAGINPGEAAIRSGFLHERWPATFPSGEGSDLAGVIEEVGDGVTAWSVGDEVLGWTDRRASHAEFVVVCGAGPGVGETPDGHGDEEAHLVRKPASVPWEVAGSLFVAGTTAHGALAAVSIQAGETLVVSGAAGGVGSLVVQLARQAGAQVIGLAGTANHAWLSAHGVIPVQYGEGEAERIRAAAGGPVHAFIDTFGAGYVELAIELGVAPGRIDTIINYPAAAKYGTRTDGSAVAATAEVLAGLVDRIAAGTLEVPIAAVYPLSQVREAYRELEQHHSHGKIVLKP